MVKGGGSWLKERKEEKGLGRTEEVDAGMPLGKKKTE